VKKGRSNVEGLPHTRLQVGKKVAGGVEKKKKISIQGFLQ